MKSRQNPEISTTCINSDPDYSFSRSKFPSTAIYDWPEFLTATTRSGQRSDANNRKAEKGATAVVLRARLMNRLQ